MNIWICLKKQREWLYKLGTTSARAKIYNKYLTAKNYKVIVLCQNKRY